MSRLLLSPVMRLSLIVCAGLAGIVYQHVSAVPASTRTAIVVAAGVAALIVFLDMANFGYLAIKLRQYPPLGRTYAPNIWPSRKYEGSSAVKRGSITLILGLVNSFFIAFAMLVVFSDT